MSVRKSNEIFNAWAKEAGINKPGSKGYMYVGEEFLPGTLHTTYTVYTNLIGHFMGPNGSLFKKYAAILDDDVKFREVYDMRKIV